MSHRYKFLMVFIKNVLLRIWFAQVTISKKLQQLGMELMCVTYAVLWSEHLSNNTIFVIIVLATELNVFAAYIGNLFSSISRYLLNLVDEVFSKISRREEITYILYETIFYIVSNKTRCLEVIEYCENLDVWICIVQSCKILVECTFLVSDSLNLIYLFVEIASLYGCWCITKIENKLIL